MISICNDYGLINIINIFRRIITIIQIVVPIILIISATIFLIKMMNNPDNKKDLKKGYNLLIAAIIVFLIPFFVNIVMGMIGEKTKFSSCWMEAKSSISSNSNYINNNTNRQQIIIDPNDYEKGSSVTKLNYSNSITIPNNVLSKASKSDLSVLVVDDNGNVLGERKAHVLREGGSTVKVFTGYAAVTLLDPEKDIVICTKYAQNMPYMGDPDVKVGDKFSVSKAATKDFPGSSNITTANIAIAIGKKYHDCSSAEDAYFKGMDEINNLIKKVGCEATHIPSSSGVNYNYKTKKGCCNAAGLSKGEDGVTANDLGLITIAAMKNKYFSSGISGHNKDGMFFIKSGTQGYKHGVWGFNYKNKRYYIVALGFNFKVEGDKRNSVSKDIYNWAIKRI